MYTIDLMKRNEEEELMLTIKTVVQYLEKLKLNTVPFDNKTFIDELSLAIDNCNLCLSRIRTRLNALEDYIQQKGI